MSAKEDPRFKHIAKIVATQLSTLKQTVTVAQVEKATPNRELSEFFGAGVDGTEARLALLYQTTADGVQYVNLTEDKVSDRCCYVVRVCDPFVSLPTKEFEDSLNFGTCSFRNGTAMNHLRSLVSTLYDPFIAKNNFAFQKKMTPSQVDQLRAHTSSFTAVLDKVRVRAREKGDVARSSAFVTHTPTHLSPAVPADTLRSPTLAPPAPPSRQVPPLLSESVRLFNAPVVCLPCQDLQAVVELPCRASPPELCG